MEAAAEATEEVGSGAVNSKEVTSGVASLSRETGRLVASLRALLLIL